MRNEELGIRNEELGMDSRLGYPSYILRICFVYPSCLIG